MLKAAGTGDLATMKAILKCKQKTRFDTRDNYGWTALHHAAAKSHPECIEFILGQKSAKPFAESHEGETALMLACISGSSVETVKLLLQTKGIVNICDNENVSPLMAACRNGSKSPAVVQALLNSGADLDLQDFVNENTALNFACAVGGHEIVNFLLHMGADPTLHDFNGLTPLHEAAFNNHLECVAVLIPFVTNLNTTDKYGRTALMLATHREHSEIVKLLLSNGADANVIDDVGQMALQVALIKMNIDLIFIVMENTSLEVTFDTTIKDISNLLISAWTSKYNDAVKLLVLLLMFKVEVNITFKEIVDNTLTLSQRKDLIKTLAGFSILPIWSFSHILTCSQLINNSELIVYSLQFYFNYMPLDLIIGNLFIALLVDESKELLDLTKNIVTMWPGINCVAKCIPTIEPSIQQSIIDTLMKNVELPLKLQHLCRNKIRYCIDPKNTSYPHLLKNISKLQLPETISDFLLYKTM